jgi:predicted secreted protein
MTNFDFAPFSTPMALAILFTAWWVCLFAVLPFGVRNHQEADETLPEGADPGAPVRPMLVRKALATTVLAVAVYAVIVVLANVMG